MAKLILLLCIGVVQFLGAYSFVRDKYLVSIQALDTSRNAYNHICSGAIVADNFIVTSASCFRKTANSAPIEFDRGKVRVIAGTQSLDEENGIIRNVKTVYLSKTLTSDHYDGDLAVVRLDKKLNQADPRIKVVQLPDHDRVDHHDKSTKLSGFRSWVRINVLLSLQVCHPDDSNRMLLCAKALYDTSTNYNIIEALSQEDIGGPVVQSGKLIGVLTDKKAFNQHASRIRFTKVHFLHDFIKKAMNSELDGGFINFLCKFTKLSAVCQRH
ncbi:trypsin zeta-like [Trichogramma pretiosum]|uniref:trypsin zeta-like n=1 Tax=Trichogramma pretiosum TaxID=7493 RepID=UPI000C71C051|nr:trypsin zeta-like [Trichogramma pretiosum]